jgi:CheY-like chemotaxis protein
MDKTTPLKIVIADDDPDDLDYMTFLLEQHKGFELAASFNDGKGVVDYLQSTHIFPHILVIDMNMPRMDADDVISHLTDAGIAQKMYVFIVSSADNSHIRDKYANVPKVDFLVKPSSLEQVNDLPEVILERLHLSNINRI